MYAAHTMLALATVLMVEYTVQLITHAGATYIIC